MLSVNIKYSMRDLYSKLAYESNQCV